MGWEFVVFCLKACLLCYVAVPVAVAIIGCFCIIVREIWRDFIYAVDNLF